MTRARTFRPTGAIAMQADGSELITQRLSRCGSAGETALSLRADAPD